jgi:hypothetical protein
MGTFIISPHCDDEVIGCFEFLTSSSSTKCNVIYDLSLESNQTRVEESKELQKLKYVENIFFLDQIPSSLLTDKDLLLFPDPYFETHPLHRKWGALGEEMARKSFNVIFYSTNMQAPYIHEVQNAKQKKLLLDQVYPSQRGLWEHDHKYWLFEGYCKWIF